MLTVNSYTLLIVNREDIYIFCDEQKEYKRKRIGTLNIVELIYLIRVLASRIKVLSERAGIIERRGKIREAVANIACESRGALTCQ